MCIEADLVSVQYIYFDFNIKVQFLIYPKRQLNILLSFLCWMFYIIIIICNL